MSASESRRVHVGSGDQRRRGRSARCPRTQPSEAPQATTRSRGADEPGGRRAPDRPGRQQIADQPAGDPAGGVAAAEQPPAERQAGRERQRVAGRDRPGPSRRGRCDHASASSTRPSTPPSAHVAHARRLPAARQRRFRGRAQRPAPDTRRPAPPWAAARRASARRAGAAAAGGGRLVGPELAIGGVDLRPAPRRAGSCRPWSAPGRSSGPCCCTRTARSVRPAAGSGYRPSSRRFRVSSLQVVRACRSDT